jgi:tRNA A-37 threonylcarbamoyl transferase component Bud32
MTAPDRVLAKAIEACLQQSPRRVSALDLSDGRRFWLKRVEAPSLRMRLQKGDPRRAFEAELQGLLRLDKLGHAVPRVVDQGSDYFVIPDAGPTLRSLLWDGEAGLEVPFTAAGTALARLHSAGIAHGRPAIRDICWDGTQVRFIDLERVTSDPRTTRNLALDLMIFAHSIYADGAHEVVSKCVEPLSNAALAAYRSDAPTEVWVAATRLASQLRWLRPIADLRPKAREWSALGPMIAAFLRDANHP